MTARLLQDVRSQSDPVCCYLQVLSGGKYFIFDPSGRHLGSTLCAAKAHAEQVSIHDCPIFDALKILVESTSVRSRGAFRMQGWVIVISNKSLTSNVASSEGTAFISERFSERFKTIHHPLINT